VIRVSCLHAKVPGFAEKLHAGKRFGTQPSFVIRLFLKEGKMTIHVEDLDVFKLSHSLCQRIYNLTKKFPPEERFGLTAQMRRSAYSIPMNLIEGSYRLNTKEYRQFVGIARGSSGEITYQLLLSRDLGYISDEEHKFSKGEYERVAKMLTKLASSLKEK
jgi:four helix bundle protein